jgi:hypothetical protein
MGIPLEEAKRAREQAETKAEREAKARPRFAGKRWTDIKFDPSSGEWLVQGLLPLLGLAVFYGRKKLFKSFIALSLAAAIAGRRKEWAGRAIKRHGAAIYIACEGGQGMHKRIDGLKQVYADLDDDLPFILIEARPNLGVERGDVDELLRGIRAMLIESDGQPVLVIIDTLVRTLHGKEENGEGMRNFADNAEHVADELHCLVIAVHHQGTGEGMRGHTSLPGASVANWHIEPIGNGERFKCRIVVEDSKDGESGFAFIVTLRQHFLGDPQRDPECASTLVVESIEPGGMSTATTSTDKAKRRPSKQQRAFMDAVRQARDKVGQMIRPFNDGPSVHAVDHEEVRPVYYAMLGGEVAEKSKRTLFARRYKAAIDAQEIIARDLDGTTMIWLPERSS